MCGLAGVYSTAFGEMEHDLFSHLLSTNVFRGAHGTGVIKVWDQDNEIEWDTSLDPSPYYCYSKSGEFIDAKYVPATVGKHHKILPVNALIGHTRHATTGEIVLANQHPFEFENVIGMHNGTVKCDFYDRDKFDTDSEAIMALLNENPVEDVITEINDWDSAYALIWIDKRDMTLNFLRNSQRPLAFTKLFTDEGVAWSSLKDDLKFCLDKAKCNSRTHWNGSKTDPYFTLAVHNQLTIPLGSDMKEASIKKYDIEDFSVTYYSKSGSYTSGSQGWPVGFINNSSGSYPESSRSPATTVEVYRTTADKKKDKKKDDEPEYKKGYRDIYGSGLQRLEWLHNEGFPKEDDYDSDLFYLNGEADPISEDEVRDLLDEGCACCGTVFDYDDHYDEIWMHTWAPDLSYYVCEECMKTNTIAIASDTNWWDKIKGLVSIN